MRNVLGLTKIGRVKIDNNVYGIGSIVLPNVCIGKNYIFGDGDGVTKDIRQIALQLETPPNLLILSNPSLKRIKHWQIF